MSVTQLQAQTVYRGMTPARTRVGYATLLVGPAYDTSSALITDDNDQLLVVRSQADLQQLYPSADPTDPASGILFSAHVALPPLTILSDENPLLIVTCGGTTTADYQSAIDAAAGDSRWRWFVLLDRLQLAVIEQTVVDHQTAGRLVLPLLTLDGQTGGTPANHVDNYTVAAANLDFTCIPVWPAENVSYGGQQVPAQHLAAALAGRLSASAQQQDPRYVAVEQPWTSPDMEGGYATKVLANDPTTTGLLSLARRVGQQQPVIHTANTNDVTDDGSTLVYLQNIRETVRQKLLLLFDDAVVRTAVATSTQTASQTANSYAYATLLSLRDNWRANGLPAFSAYTVSSSLADNLLTVDAQLVVPVGFSTVVINVQAEVL